MKKSIISLFVGSALCASVFLVGCSEAERVYDCARICDRYADCLDSSLDKTECVDKCEAKGDADSSFADKASECESCLGDKDCASSTLGCAGKCAEVVAESAMGQDNAE